jgi:glucose uptake protein
MICWGSWANAIKLAPGWPIQLFYWDYAAGILVGTFGLGAAMGGGPHVFLSAIAYGDAHHLLLAVAGGIIFNVANLLLVAAIEIAGLAVAFPLGIGLALIVGVLLNYLVAPTGNPWLLFSGVALVAIAIIIDAIAYRRRDIVHQHATRRGIVISIAAGVLMGLFYPLVARSMRGTHALGAYSGAFVFAVGIALCTIPANLWFMRHPLDRLDKLRVKQYFSGKAVWHLWGLVGGVVWCAGAVFSFAASEARFVGPAIAYAIGQGATMVSACWGIFVWNEFQGAPSRSRRLLPAMFLFFVGGLAVIALAAEIH